MNRLLVIVVVTCALGSSAFAASSSINPSEDAFVSAAAPNSNYGSAGALEVSANGLPKGGFQSLLKFDFASTKTNFDTTFGVNNWHVQSVSLDLVAANPANALFNASAAGQFGINWMQNDGWAEGTGTPMTPTSTGITFSTLPSFVGAGDQSLGLFNFAGGTSGTNSWSLTTSSGFVADITSGSLGSLLMFPNDSAVSYLSNSRNFTTEASRPLLTVNAIALPEPAGVVLLSLVAAAKAQRRDRRKLSS